MIITLDEYYRWIKNMSKNKTGTSWVFVTINPDYYPETKQKKLYQDDQNNLYYIEDKVRMYLTIGEKK